MSDWMYDRGLLLILVGVQVAWLGAFAWSFARVMGVI